LFEDETLFKFRKDENGRINIYNASKIKIDNVIKIIHNRANGFHDYYVNSKLCEKWIDCGFVVNVVTQIPDFLPEFDYFTWRAAVLICENIHVMNFEDTKEIIWFFEKTKNYPSFATFESNSLSKMMKLLKKVYKRFINFDSNAANEVLHIIKLLDSINRNFHNS
jgi:hypothetical protein